MSASTTRTAPQLRTRIVAALLGLGLATAGLTPLVAAPAGAATARSSTACRSFTVAKARVHTMATRREATLARLVGALQARRDPWALNGPHVTALQSASSAIAALDTRIQGTCYTTVEALRTDATTMLTSYRVYWLRVPQTHGIEAADRLAEARTRLGSVAARLAAHVAGNAKAQTDLAAMNQALAAADTALGTPPTPSAHIGALPGLAPAADMTADVGAMEAARADLLTVRASLVQARADGLSVVTDLGG
jgi:hypothetical protein